MYADLTFRFGIVRNCKPQYGVTNDPIPESREHNSGYPRWQPFWGQFHGAATHKNVLNTKALRKRVTSQNVGVTLVSRALLSPCKPPKKAAFKH